MNAVEIEEAVSALAAAPFDPMEFPYAFLAAFGNKETTIQRLRAGSSNTSDIKGGVLQRSNIHIAVSPVGKVSETLTALRASPKTAKGKVKFVLATDGNHFEAEELGTGEPIACAYSDVANNFGFFLPLAGISTVAEIKNNPIDIKATSRLNKLYVELLKENEEWTTDARRQELNQFMARLIFCFFAEDTGIFMREGLFTNCLQQMTDNQSNNTHEVIKELFRAMDIHPTERKARSIKPWADVFPYVNGGLFTEQIDCPRFSRIARSYLLRVGELNWKEINPDIFGSMIQAVADDDERGELGMHYTSVPNILKVLDPLFLDDLRHQLEDAEDNPRKLLNLRKRIAAIRLFDPACGSGNFLVIAYIKMREIEAEIIKRRNEQHDTEAQKSWIKLTNLYGIEIKSFAAEVARLSLLIAEFQCNVRLIGQREACLDVLPLHDSGHIQTGNALQMDWFKVCPPPLKPGLIEEDLGGPTGLLALDSKTPDIETYICGNPPYLGSKWLLETHKEDLRASVEPYSHDWKSMDYVSGWLFKAAAYSKATDARAGFVTTNSVFQGQQIELIRPLFDDLGREIFFAHTSFKWANLASNKAVVTVVAIGLAPRSNVPKILISQGDLGDVVVRKVERINAYLVPAQEVFVTSAAQPINGLPAMVFGNMPRDGGNLLLTAEEKTKCETQIPEAREFIRYFVGAEDCIDGKFRGCIWINEKDWPRAAEIDFINSRLQATREFRQKSKAPSTQGFAARPYRFVQIQGVAKRQAIIVPRHSSEHRPYLPVSVLPSNVIVADSAIALYDAPLWNVALIASRLHLVWIATVCGKIKTDFRYSNTLGWNTFPVPSLTENQKEALARCAEDILLAREAHFPATIANLYDPDTMPANLRSAHERNDEALERIYIGRRFKNDTERLEKLFDMYTRMTKDEKPRKGKATS